MPAAATAPAPATSRAPIRAARATQILGVPVVYADGMFRLVPDPPAPRCHGKRCGCICARCDRRPHKAPEPTRQPWQPVVIAGGKA